MLILRCSGCGAEVPEELRFCLICRASLFPKTAYDLSVTDFGYQPDLDAIATMSATGPLPYILKNLTLSNLENTMISKLSAEGHRVTYPCELDTILRDCAVLLSIEHLPEVFITESDELNAFTFGTEDRAYLVADASLLRTLSQPELMAVIAHELGHVRSGHMLYHTLAEALGRGISLSGSFVGLDALSIPINLALLSWHRQSEVTADRASLLVVNDLQVMQSLLSKLSTVRGKATIRQTETRSTGILESVSHLFRTHPVYADRLKLAEQFVESQEFSRAKRKIELRQSLLSGLVPICRFCAGSKPVEKLFCPKCGRCQI
jgi:Zn-dependent protease with chaperone function